MKTWLLILFLAILFVQDLEAQKGLVLTVSLTSTKKDSLNNISVQLYQLPDSSLVRLRLFNGKPLSFTVNRQTGYFIIASSTGFEKAEKQVFIGDKPISVILVLKRKISSLQNVIVVSRKPLMKQEDDKTVIDAEPLANTSTNAYEVLEKIPGAVMDQDGNIYQIGRAHV